MLETPVRIAIVDDHSMFREGLANLLMEHAQIKILFEARNGLTMQEAVAKHGPPDVMLMDINMPGMNGHEATSWLKQHFPSIHVLALSMYEDDETIIKMIRSGAGGYILKESNVHELVRAIFSINQTGFYINQVVSGRLIRNIQEKNADGQSPSPKKLLSAREIKFTQMCCSDLTYKEIADVMKVSHRTVDGYRDAIFEKLQVKSRTGLVLFAIKEGIYVIA